MTLSRQRFTLSLFPALALLSSASADQPDSTSPPTTPSQQSISPAELASPPWTDSRRHGVALPKPKTPGAIRLASYNIENLFDEHDDPALTGKNEDIDDHKLPAHQRNAAIAIKLIDADILLLQEVESRQALLEFRDTYLHDMGYTHVASLDSGDPRGIEQSILSRFPISNDKVWPEQDLAGLHPQRWGRQPNENAGQKITLKRSPLFANITIPAGAVQLQDRSTNPADYTLHLFVVHHKSGAPGGYWREAEAKRFIQWAADIQQSNPDANVLFAGDFNARAGDASVQLYFDAGFIDAFVAAGVKKPADPARHTPAGNPENAQPTDSKPTDSKPPDSKPFDEHLITHASERTIDFILLNPALAKELAPQSPFVLGTGARKRGEDFRNTPAPPGWASDHYPLVIDLFPVDQ